VGEETQGGLFEDLDYFLLLRGYLQKCMLLLGFKDERLGCRKNVVSGDRREFGPKKIGALDLQ